MDFSWEPFILSIQLASVTTALLLALGLPASYLIFFHGSRAAPVLKSLVSLPLVLPPTVMGYYLLIAFRPEGSLGILGQAIFGTDLVFSFTGLVAGSIIFSFPFMVNPVLSALENLPHNFRDAAFTLGKSKISTFYHVMIPNIRPSILVGAVMAFAHTIGEFGMVLMIGGNIPGKTRVASIAIYNEVESMNYADVNFYAGVLLVFSLAVLLAVYSFQHQRQIELI